MPVATALKRIASAAAVIAAIGVGHPHDSARAMQAGRVEPRCAEAAAEEQLRTLDRRIRALADTADVSAASAELNSLLGSKCFRSATEIFHTPADSSASLREWWIRGGHQWLQSYLSLPARGPDGSPGLHIVVPPDLPPSMYLTAGSGYPFETILCTAGDDRCGDTTRQWVSKAHAAFADLRTDRRRRFEPERLGENARAVSERCARESADYASDRYAAWLGCVESAAPRRATLPIGGFRIPTEGWLIVTGSRRRDDKCERSSAYDLASGTAVSFVSCTAERYVRRRGIIRTPVRADDIRTGTLRVERLREAAWMLLLRGTAEDIRTDGVLYPLPEGLEPQSVIPFSRHLSLGGFAVPGDMTTLVWALAAANRPLVVGTVSWPESFNDADTYAASLLRVAEDGVVEGCMPKTPPSIEQVESGASVFLNEAGPQHRQSVARSYRTAVAKWGSLTTCQ